MIPTRPEMAGTSTKRSQHWSERIVFWAVVMAFLIPVFGFIGFGLLGTPMCATDELGCESSADVLTRSAQFFGVSFESIQSIYLWGIGVFGSLLVVELVVMGAFALWDRRQRQHTSTSIHKQKREM